MSRYIKNRKKSTKSKVPLDYQLELFSKRNNINKKHNKSYFEMGPKTKGIQKATGIYHDCSDSWQLESKENIYTIPSENKLEWYKSLPIDRIIPKKPLTTFYLHKTNKEKIISDAFPRINNQTNLCVTINDKKLKLLIKTMSFCKFNKGVTPAGTEGRQTKDGKPMKQWLKLAIFGMVFIKLSENYYLCFKQRYNNNGERFVSKSIIDKENQDKIRFHIGVGYCKLENDDKHMKGLICLSPDYRDETCMELIRLDGGNKDDYIEISVCNTMSNTKVILYKKKYNKKNKIEIIKNINITNNNYIKCINDVTNIPPIPDMNDCNIVNGYFANKNRLINTVFSNGYDNNIYSITNQTNDIEEDIDMSITFEQKIENNLSKIRQSIKNNKCLSIKDQDEVILSLKYVTDLLNGYTTTTNYNEYNIQSISQQLPPLPMLPFDNINVGSKRQNVVTNNQQLPALKKPRH